MCNLDKIFVVSPLYFRRAREVLEAGRQTFKKDSRTQIRYENLFTNVQDAAMRTIPDMIVYKQFIQRINGYYSVNFHTSSEPYEPGEIYTARDRIHGFYGYFRPFLFGVPTMRVYFKDVLAIGEQNTDIVAIADKMIILE